MKKNIKLAFLAVAILIATLSPATEVYAAAGKTTIAVSSGEINVGESLSVTVRAKTDSGDTAKAKMKLTYDDDILEFVSCSVTHDGGAGGSVTATTSSMTVKFKAVDEGKASLLVEASNGVNASSGSSLSSVEGCSTKVTVNAGSGSSSSGRLSADNSLTELILSDGTLSPAFAGNVVNYTASVPNSVTDVEVEVKTANNNATIEAITGNTDLQVGANTIKILVKAENGALATYTVELTREEAVEEIPPVEEETEQTPMQDVEDTTNEELEEALSRNEYLSNSYNKLEEKYQREKEFSRSVIYTLIFVIAILIVVIINLVIFYRRKLDEDFDDSFEEKRSSKKVEEKPVVKPIEVKQEVPKKEVPQPKVEKQESSKKELFKKEQIPVKDVKAEEKKSVKPVENKKEEKPSIKKVEVTKNFEVFDFNDED